MACAKLNQFCRSLKAHVLMCDTCCADCSAVRWSYQKLFDTAVNPKQIGACAVPPGTQRLSTSAEPGRC